jgi:phospholipid/cholesterol/gamma-HCH transport system substrate-binding protein
MSRLFLHRRLLGVVFVALLATAIWVVYGVFTQKFSDFDEVTLQTDTIGLQLPSRADVKVRGVIVGQVIDRATGPDGATLTLGIDPDKIGQIPSNVTASLLPKTLFGEKYVSLDVPKDAASTALRAGQDITQTKLPAEVEQVLNDIYPLLRAVQPAELNYTLNAVASALEGRGDEIGESIVTLDSYLKRLNPQVPQLMQDLRELATVSDTYADVLPQIAQTLRNTIKTGGTLVEKQQKLNRFLKEVSGLSDTAKGFLDANGKNVIRLGQLSVPQLQLLERYSPEFPCLLRGIVRQAPMLGTTFRGFVFHINMVTMEHQPRPYNASDVPVLGADNPPNCAGLPYPPVPYPALPNLDDGTDNIGRGDNQRVATGFDATDPLVAGTAGTERDQDLINALTAPVLGVPIDEVPDLATLLFGPLAAGTEVSVR